MSPDTLQIRLPVAKTPDVTAAPTFTLDRPIEGTTIGIRHEGSWRSWMLIAGEWERFLERDGAKPVIVQTGERVGHEGEQTRAARRGVGRLGRLRGRRASAPAGRARRGASHDAVALETSSKPSIVAVTAEFETHARNMATFLGHPDLKVLVLPYPLEARPDEELREIAVDYYPQLPRAPAGRQSERAHQRGRRPSTPIPRRSTSSRWTKAGATASRSSRRPTTASRRGSRPRRTPPTT